MCQEKKGRKLSQRHMGHAMNLWCGPAVAFITPNFPDTYHRLMVDLHEGPGPSGAPQPAAEFVPMMQREEPTLPTLERMHQIGAENPRAQARFFLLQTELWYRHGVGVDELSVGRVHLARRPDVKSREDDYACSLQPSLVRAAMALIAMFEAQGRGFMHGHCKVHGSERIDLAALRKLL